MPTQSDLAVSNLGPCRFESPLQAKGRTFLDETVRVRFEQHVGGDPSEAVTLSFEKAGPRERIFFDPERTTAAFVTCGGLSPGLNNVIRSGFLELTHNYGVRRILGIRNGYAGLNPDSGFEPITLTHRFVHDIHHLGGTVLGSSRGGQDPSITVDFLDEQEIDILFCIGGDGTQRGAHAIQQETLKRGLAKSVVGIPKTIDNDVPYVYMSFGYVTALGVANEVLTGAHVEACGAPNGSAGEADGADAGFIAAGAAEPGGQLRPQCPRSLSLEGRTASSPPSSAASSGAVTRWSWSPRGPASTSSRARRWSATHRETSATRTSASSCGTGSKPTSPSGRSRSISSTSIRATRSAASRPPPGIGS
jgi:6-phosphofructokinase 1